MLAYPPISVPLRLRGPAANVGEDARGDALGGAARLEFVNLVADQQVEEAPHPVLHVVCQRVAGGAGPVGLPEEGAAAGAGALAAIQVLVREGNPRPCPLPARCSRGSRGP